MLFVDYSASPPFPHSLVHSFYLYCIIICHVILLFYILHRNKIKLSLYIITCWLGAQSDPLGILQQPIQGTPLNLLNWVRTSGT